MKLVDTLGKKPIIIAEVGQNHQGSLYVWANLDTKTVSITVVFNDGMMCLLAAGNTFVPYSGNQPWDKPPEKKYLP